jgi:hypothetical protein
MWAPWSAAWTRANLLKHIALDEHLLFVERQHWYGFERRWFVRLRFGPREIFVPALTQAFLTTTPGSNQTYTSDATWNNANNTIEVIGAGASGGRFGAGTGHATGGGGGAYCKISNFTFTTPGTTTATYQIGSGGLAVTGTGGASGNNGGKTWFNAAAFPVSGTAVGADAGLAGASGTASVNGGAGGAIANNYPASTGFAGGRGGNLTGASGSGGSGGGGAAGPNAAGNQGVDDATTNSAVATAGGQGDGTFGGLGGAAISSGHVGTEWDATHGSGGGGGGGGNNSGTGSGGNYGGGGGGVRSSAGSTTSGAGTQGIIVLTWTPAVGFGEFVSLNQAVQRAANW